MCHYSNPNALAYHSLSIVTVWRRRLPAAPDLTLISQIRAAHLLPASGWHHRCASSSPPTMAACIFLSSDCGRSGHSVVAWAARQRKEPGVAWYVGGGLMACRSTIGAAASEPEDNKDNYVLPPDPKVIHLFVTGHRADELALFTLFGVGFSNRTS